MDKLIQVEVAYASVDQQFLVACDVPQGASIRQAILASDVLKDFPELVLDELSVGVFSRRRKLDDEIKSGERVEIYRPLVIDPMEARRLRAKSK